MSSDGSRALLHTGFDFGNATWSNRHHDDVPQAAMSLSSSSSSGEPSHLLYGGRPSYVSPPSPGIATITSEALLLMGAARRPSQSSPSVSPDSERIPIAPVPASCAGDEHTTSGVETSLGRLPCIQEDGGVSLAGGPLGKARVGEEDSDGRDDPPPAYQRF